MGRYQCGTECSNVAVVAQFPVRSMTTSEGPISIA
jgi:hypothetical protein